MIRLLMLTLFGFVWAGLFSFLLILDSCNNGKPPPELNATVTQPTEILPELRPLRTAPMCWTRRAAQIRLYLQWAEEQFNNSHAVQLIAMSSPPYYANSR